MYGIADSFKRASRLTDVRFCNVRLVHWLAMRLLRPEHLWDDEALSSEKSGRGIDLWHARLFVLHDPPQTFDAAKVAWLASGYWNEGGDQ